MLRLLRAGSRPGRPAPLVRIVAALLVVGMLVAVAPFLAAFIMWVVDLL